jgi:hypothetical protein
MFYFIIGGVSLKFPHTSSLSIFGTILAWKSFAPVVQLFKGQFSFDVIHGVVTLTTIILAFSAFRIHLYYGKINPVNEKNLLSGRVLHPDELTSSLFRQIGNFLGLAAAVSIVGFFIFTGFNTIVVDHFKPNTDLWGLLVETVEYAALLGLTFVLLSFRYNSQTEAKNDFGLRLNGFVLFVLGYLIINS